MSAISELSTLKRRKGPLSAAEKKANGREGAKAYQTCLKVPPTWSGSLKEVKGTRQR